jgi:hypothetical protein
MSQIRWRSKILLAKLETTYGVDAAPTGTADAVLAKDVVLTPMEGSDVDRDFERPFLGSDQTIPTDLHAKLAFRVELAPSGTPGVAPAWGTLLRACAVAQTIVASTSVTYNPVSEGHESATVHLMIGGTRFVMVGGRGNAKLNLGASGVPHIEFEFTGLFRQPSEQSRPTPVFTSWRQGQIATLANTPTFTIASTALVLRSLMLDLGNQIEPRFLIGSEAILITDKADSVEMTVEAVALTTLNPFALAAAESTVALSLVHGTGAGRITTLAIPRLQVQRPQGLSNAQNIMEWPLRGVPIPATGNDQWTLTLT